MCTFADLSKPQNYLARAEHGWIGTPRMHAALQLTGTLSWAPGGQALHGTPGSSPTCPALQHRAHCTEPLTMLGMHQLLRMLHHNAHTKVDTAVHEQPANHDTCAQTSKLNDHCITANSHLLIQAQTYVS